MAFNPNEPKNGEVVDADFLRAQLNALNDKITIPKLPEYSTIAHPVEGNLAFNYITHSLCYYDGRDWQTLGY
jgi:hypothetical protein